MYFVRKQESVFLLVKPVRTLRSHVTEGSGYPVTVHDSVTGSFSFAIRFFSGTLAVGGSVNKWNGTPWMKS
jgi:hypothetical protein